MDTPSSPSRTAAQRGRAFERVALLAGATGLIGRALLPMLKASPSYAHMHVLLRAELLADAGVGDPHFAGATMPNMMDWSTCTAVERDPERVSGAWVFRGSRVPVAALFENLEDGVAVGEFAELFPGISLAQARAVLEHAAHSSLATA